MPSKHIPDKTWEKVEKEYVKAVIKTKSDIKSVDLLNLLILKGLKDMKEADYEKLKKK